MNNIFKNKKASITVMDWDTCLTGADIVVNDFNKAEKIKDRVTGLDFKQFTSTVERES